MKKNRLKNFILLTATSSMLLACADRHIYQGDRHYDSWAYAEAISHYEKVYYKNPTKEIGLKLADSYYKTGDLLAAEAVYEKAKNVLNQYLSAHPNDQAANMLLASCNSINDRYRDTSLYELKPIELEGFVNTFSVAEYEESIVFVADKKAFAGRKQNPWTADSYLDLYQMNHAEDGSWLNPELLKGDINGPFHEGPASFSADGTEIYFTRSNYFKRKMELNDERENNLKIFKATLIDGEWTNLEELPFNSDDYSVGHPALTPCCHTLYFVSDMPGGYGGTDIYMSTFADGKWSQPENLGESVNTSGNEMFPYYDEDGTLYFSSDAHNSMGGLDVFITYFNGEEWAKPENLNYPINSMKDDFGFVYNPESSTGFVSSSRTDKDKIYEFKKVPPKFNLYGFAHMKGTKTPVAGVNVLITNVDTGEEITATSDENGNFKMKLTNESTFGLLCTKIGCFSRTDELSTKGLKYSEDFYADFEVEEIIINKPIVLEDIYYDFDKWHIRPDAAIELNKLVKLLKDNPNIEIEMGSHTDARGSDKYNEILSERRAYAAMLYLVSAGIDFSRLSSKGYGESMLVNECKNDVPCSEKKHQENRRTEFKVTKINQ